MSDIWRESPYSLMIPLFDNPFWAVYTELSVFCLCSSRNSFEVGAVTLEYSAAKARSTAFCFSVSRE